MEHPSEKALKNYLHEHPNADKSKHHVKEHDDEGGHDEHGEKEEKKSWKDRLKDLSGKAKSFLDKAPKVAKQFVEDPAFRRKSLIEAHDKLEAAPAAMVKSLVKTVKEEVHEFKEAGQGIAAVMKGGKMTPHQKKALKTVAFHVALTAAATALTVTGGPLAGAAAFGKSMAKHVAMKAASNALGHLHVLEEFHHIGHGLHHVIEKLAAEDKLDPEEVMTQYVMALVAKEIRDLDDDGIVEALNASDEEGDDEGDTKTAAMALRIAAEYGKKNS
jgi:hypothetical protein